MKRLLSSLLLGLIISLGLFWLMQYMILNNQQGFKQTDNLQMVEFVRLKKESQTRIRDRKKLPPPKPKKRPEPPKLKQIKAPIAQQKHLDLDIPDLDIPLQTERFSGSLLTGVQMGAGKVRSNVIPLLRIPPRYPPRAASRRIEGWVKVEFTISETGTVKDAKVVASEPVTIFDKAALKAIAKWKFKPKNIDGETFAQRAVQVLQFKLSR